jgi:hypothetical protein
MRILGIEETIRTMGACGGPLRAISARRSEDPGRVRRQNEPAAIARYRTAAEACVTRCARGAFSTFIAIRHEAFLHGLGREREVATEPDNGLSRQAPGSSQTAFSAHRDRTFTASAGSRRLPTVQRPRRPRPRGGVLRPGRCRVKQSAHERISTCTSVPLTGGRPSRDSSVGPAIAWTWPASPSRLRARPRRGKVAAASGSGRARWWEHDPRCPRSANARSCTA